MTKRPSYKELESEALRWRNAFNEERQARSHAQNSEAEARKQFNDLKERLSNSEMENQRLRGYIQRVQEDDVVREELVATGDPTGAQQLVPKRKHSVFNEPNQYSQFGAEPNSYIGHIRDERSRRQHWITY